MDTTGGMECPIHGYIKLIDEAFDDYMKNPNEDGNKA